MTPEYFKGDLTERKFDAAVAPTLQNISLGLDEFYAQGYNATPFLLMLYDEARIPFSERIAKAAFVEFIKETLKRFPTIGTFDTYLFILRAIFGELSEIYFEVTAPGKLQIDINATSALEFDWVHADMNGATDLVLTSDGDNIIFRGVAGIETEYELELLFSEIMPAGIIPDINLSFYNRSDWVAEDSELYFSMIDFEGNQLVFNEFG